MLFDFWTNSSLQCIYQAKYVPNIYRWTYVEIHEEIVYTYKQLFVFQNDQFVLECTVCFTKYGIANIYYLTIIEKIFLSYFILYNSFYTNDRFNTKNCVSTVQYLMLR